MRWLRVIQRWFQGDRLGHEIDDELAFHLEMRERELIEQGVPPEQARRAARRQFGNGTLVKEDSRAVWSFVWLETRWRDLGYAVRTLRKNPGFTTVAVLSLALGIGFNIAIFSILNALVLRELPVPQPERLVELSGVYRNGSRVPFSFPTFEEIERGQRVFSGLFGRTGIYGADVDVNGTLFRAHVRAVTGNYYSELGATPLLGRLIVTEDLDKDVAVIGHDFWDRRFGRDPAVLGKTIRVQGRPLTIIGVTRRWFTGVTRGQSPEITIPITAAPFPRQSRSSLWVFATGRLNEGVTIEQARGQLNSFWPEVRLATVPTQSPGERRQSFLSMRLEVESAATGSSAGLRSEFVEPLYLLMGIVGLILAVVCVNLASLMLARDATRGREMSTRLALGASPWQIVRQLMTESALLSAAGAAPALVFAYWGGPFFLSLLSRGTPVPVVLDLGPDWRVFSFTAIALILTALLVGAAPAWRLSREAAGSILHRNEGASGRGTGTLGNALIITQIALSLVLLQGAGLLLRTFESLRSFDPGFRKANVLEMSLYRKPEIDKDLDIGSYRRQLIERVSRLPGVFSVALSNLSVPTGEDGWSDTVSMRADSNSSGELLTKIMFVSPGFFKTLGIPLVAGRDFDWRDDAESPPVAIIDSNLGRRLLPSGNEIGKRVRFGVQPGFQDLEIAGVVQTARLVDLRDANAHVIYVPGLQHPRFSRRGNLYVCASNPAALVGAIEHEIKSFGHEYSTGAYTLQRSSDQALLHERVTAMLASFCASVALFLVGIGLFGLMSYTVTRRTREIGIRMALGTQRSNVLRMVLGDGLRLSLIGIGIGLVAALGLTQLIESQLYGVTPTDPETFTAVVAVLLAVGLLASYVPARRATKVDPMQALRYEQ